MSDHFRLSPSSADRWFNCPAAPSVEARYPDKSSNHADEGTAAHDFAHTCMRMGFDLQGFLGETWEVKDHKLEITQEVINYLQPGVDRFNELCGDTPPDIELQVPLDPWLPGGFGTLDRGATLPHEIIIWDLKYGAGVPVHAERNLQLALYALGYWQHFARHKTKATTFRLVIDQPRCSRGGGEWTTTLRDLLDIGAFLEKAAKATENPNAPRVPSDKGCQFCKAKHECLEYDAFRLAGVGLDFEDLDRDPPAELPEPRGMTPARIAAILDRRAAFTSWLSEIEKRAFEMTSNKWTIPGYRLGEGEQGDRAWTDETAAETALSRYLDEGKIWKRKLVSPGAAEKLLTRHEWRQLPRGLYSRAPGKPKLVRDDDPRPAPKPVADEFDDLDGDATL